MKTKLFSVIPAKAGIQLSLILLVALIVFSAPAPAFAAAPTAAELNSAFTRNLTVGSTGTDVRILQRFLNANGFTIASSGNGSPGNESTYFGPATAAALARYQSSVGISPASGYFGPATRSRISSSSGVSGGVTLSTISTANTIVITPPGETITQQQSSSVTIQDTDGGTSIWDISNSPTRVLTPIGFFIVGGASDINISQLQLIISGSSLTATSTMSFSISVTYPDGTVRTLPGQFTLFENESRPYSLRLTANTLLPVTVHAGEQVLFRFYNFNVSGLYTGNLNIEIPAGGIISDTGAVLGPLIATSIPIIVRSGSNNPDVFLEITERAIFEPTNVVAGRENELLGAINLRNTSPQNLSVSRIIFNLINGRPQSINNLKLFAADISESGIITPERLIGQVVFQGLEATATISNLIISAGSSAIIYFRADLAQVGTDQPGRAGERISLSFPANAITVVSNNNSRMNNHSEALSLNRIVYVIDIPVPVPPSISGRVINESGAGVNGVSVTLNSQQSVTTSPDGSFTFTSSFLGYRAGTVYTLSATIPTGYESISAQNARVSGNSFTYQVFGFDCSPSENYCSDAITPPLRHYTSFAYTNDLPSDTGFIFQLRRPAPLSISVSVVDNQNLPLSNVKVLVSRNNSRIEVGRTDTNGQLTINASAAPLSFRRGALYLISVEAPTGYYATASNARVRAQSYNWQALGIDCRARGSVCLDALRSLRLESNADNAAANDLETDNFIFTIAPVAVSTRTPLTGTGTNETVNGTNTGGGVITSDPNPVSTPAINFPDITGRVTNDAGEGVSGAAIAVNNVIRATTGADGSFTILGSDLRFRKGALFEISVDSVPFIYDSIRATRSRTAGAKAYNWQALGVNCADLVSGGCRDALAALGLYQYLNNTNPVDLADDNFTFMIVRPASSPNYSNSSGGLTEITSNTTTGPTGVTSPTQSFFDIYGTVTDSRGNGIINAVVILNNGVARTTTQLGGDFLFNGAQIRFPLGASYSLTVEAPPGTNYSGSQALSGSTVVGASYQWQILGYNCAGRSDGVCIGSSSTKDLPSDTNFHFILKDGPSSAVPAGSSLNTASALMNLGRILFFWR